MAVSPTKPNSSTPSEVPYVMTYAPSWHNTEFHVHETGYEAALKQAPAEPRSGTTPEPFPPGPKVRGRIWS